MDIRNFFGGGSGAVKKTPVVASPVTTKFDETSIQKKSNRVIKDEDDDEEKTTVSQPCSSIDVPKTKDEDNLRDIAPEGKENRVENKEKGEMTSENPECKSDSHECKDENIPADLADMITWKCGESVPYQVVVDTFDKVASVTGRLDKENLFCKLFRCVIVTTPADLDSVVYLASNTISPAYDGLELGIGDSLLVKAIVESTGRKKEAVDEAYRIEVATPI